MTRTLHASRWLVRRALCLALGAVLAVAGCRKGPPDSKFALIGAVDRALADRDAAALAALLLPPEQVDALCPGLPAERRQALRADAEARRRDGSKAIAECLALLGDEPLRHLALNYGTDSGPAEDGCRPEFLTHEDSELFYGSGDRVLKVKLYDSWSADGRFGLSRAPRCTVKRDTVRDWEAQTAGFLLRCRIDPWPMVTQAWGSGLACE